MGSGNGISGSGVDDEPEDLDEEEVEEGEEEEEEEEEEESVEVRPKKKSSSSKKKEEPEPKKRGRGRPRGPIGRVPDRVGKDDEQADLLWMKILDEMTNKTGDFEGKDASPRDMFIRVNRISPGEFLQCGTVEAGAVTTDERKSGADKLRDAIIDRFHGTCQTAARYEVLFMWKRGTTFFHRGVIDLAAPWEIKAWREWDAAQPQAGGAPPGVGRIPGAPVMPPSPMQAPWMQQQWPAYNPNMPPYGPPGPQPQQQHPHPQPDQRDQLIREQAAELRRLNQRLDTLERPAAPVAPAGPQPRGPLTIDDLNTLQAAVGKLGLDLVPKGTGAVAAPVAAAAPAPAAKQRGDEGDEMEAMLDRIERNKKLEERARRLFGIEEPAAEEEEEEKPKPEPSSSGVHFYPVPGATWPDGSQPQIAKNDDDEYDVMGTLAANPFFINKFGGALIGLASRIVPGTPQEAKEQLPEEQPATTHRHQTAPAEEKKETKKSGGWDL